MKKSNGFVIQPTEQQNYFFIKCPRCGERSLRVKECGNEVHYKCLNIDCHFSKVQKETDGSGVVIVGSCVVFLALLAIIFA